MATGERDREVQQLEAARARDEGPLGYDVGSLTCLKGNHHGEALAFLGEGLNAAREVNTVWGKHPALGHFIDSSNVEYGK